ncbi:MAG: HAMP domain-containing sensor histidine kinase, partial [Pseudomonadota bacterium]
LTRMKLELELLGDGPEIDELRSDVAEMERMIEGYLAFARGEGTEESATVDVVAFVEEIVSAGLREGANAMLDVEIDRGEQGALLTIRPQALRLALANLLSNAGRHAQQIWVSLIIEPETVIILIDDDGPGIEEELLDEVFRPFYRIDPSRNPQTGGTGLGLSIARDVIRGHGGDLTLGRAPQGGLRCQVRLPR